MVATSAKVAVWWRQLGTMARFVLFGVASALVALLVFLAEADRGSLFPGSNVAVFIFVNAAILLLLGLGFVVGRNLVKLFFDRRRNIFGARLRSKLVASFVGLLLIPTGIVFILASGFLQKAMDGWLSTPVEQAVQGATQIAKVHLTQQKEKAGLLAEEVASQTGVTGELLELERARWGAYFLGVYERGELLHQAVHPVTELPEFEPPPVSRRMLSSVKTPRIELIERRTHSYARAIVPVGSERHVVATLRIDDEIIGTIGDIQQSYREYGQLRMYRNPLRHGYLLSLAIITGLILFAAVWFGFYLAREITTPIERLAEATHEVARGNYDIRVREGGDDELGVLVQSFNTMTADLRASIAESQQRRKFIETVVHELNVGVISIDGQGVILLANDSAEKLLGDSLVGQNFFELLPQLTPGIEDIKELLQVADHQPQERTLSLFSRGLDRQVVATALSLESGDERLLILEDITELARSQQMIAWREVARRIAHEIKNPLTPIQLCAQRIERLTVRDATVAEKVQDSTREILTNVESIKRLADEFSRFARMPAAVVSQQDLNEILTDVVKTFAEAHPKIAFSTALDARLPQVSIDAEQMRRALVNLIDNAVMALHATPEAMVEVMSFYIPQRHRYGFEVRDNGPGIPAHAKTRVFEPYFTTKPTGTGLGLPIVSTIVHDHRGSIRLFDNYPHGCRFVVELPTA